MSHTRKKTHTAIYHIFCFVFSSQVKSSHVIHKGLGVFRSSGIVTSGVVGLARIAHETAHVADEVGAVVKAGITVAAQAVFVLVMLLRALLFSQFEAGSVLFGSHHGSSGGSPVVRSSSSSHRSSFGCL